MVLLLQNILGIILAVTTLYCGSTLRRATLRYPARPRDPRSMEARQSPKQQTPAEPLRYRAESRCSRARTCRRIGVRSVKNLLSLRRSTAMRATVQSVLEKRSTVATTNLDYLPSYDLSFFVDFLGYCALVIGSVALGW